MDLYSGFSLNNCTYSEKFDGVRGIWTGHCLTTRSGNVIDVPEWFTAQLPDSPLMGELWAGRGKFELASSVCRTFDPDSPRWRQIRYMVFSGQPGYSGRYGEHVKMVRQRPITGGMPEATAARDRIIGRGGEGIVIRKPCGATYKHKKVEDDDAVVIGHEEGRGRNAGRLGALVVRDRAGRQFKVGGGLTDALRNCPPAVGSVITFRFQGRTRNGKPRFPAFTNLRAEGTLKLTA